MKKRVSPAERFRVFSDEYIISIDASMRGFFERKTRDADLPFMREMYGLLSEYCTRSGKRVRPLVFLMSCFGYGGGRKRGDMVRIAASLEMMHSFLLLQDDIIDKSVLRRGGKALHLVCGDRYCAHSHNPNIGNDVALILGDVLFADALEIIEETALPRRLKDRFMKVFSATLEITAWGQILDILHSNSRKVDAPRETAARIAMMKTAYYTVYYPMLMGYLLAGKDSPKEKDRIREFALPLGLAFQIRDDIMGMFGKEKETGKPSDSDILEGKVTMLVDETVERLRGRDRARFISLFTKKRKVARDVRAVRTMVEQSGSLDAVKDRHRDLIGKSCELLPGLSLAEEYRSMVRGLVDLISVIK